MSPIAPPARTCRVLPKPSLFPYRMEWLPLGFFFGAALFCLAGFFLRSLIISEQNEFSANELRGGFDAESRILLVRRLLREGFLTISAR
jgi:hypothetical protein